MSRYQQHRHQMIETHIKQYLPTAQNPYREANMMCNLRILSGAESSLCSSTRQPVSSQNLTSL